MPQKYLIDIPHPHFVHFFKNIIFLLGKENVLVTCQDSGIITRLLDSYSIQYHVVGRKYSSIFGKGLGQVKYLMHYIRLIRKNKIDVLLGMSPAIALAAKLTRKTIFFFDDDDSSVQPLTKKLTVPLSDYIITPKCLEFENYGNKQICYKGYQELGYLAPDYFEADETIIRKYNLHKHSYFIIRFNDFVAHHDIGHEGIPEKVKDKLIELLLPHGEVFITSESPLKEKFRKYQLKAEPADIHHLLAFAKMYIGDSQTMASEAAVLGVPNLRCNTFKNKIAYLNELEFVHDLTYAFFPTETDEMLRKIDILLNNPDTLKIWQEKRRVMLGKMEDVNKFILELLSKH